MTSKILVVYASRSGYTAGIAEAIGKTLSAHSIPADVRPVSDFLGPSAASLKDYRAVVAGSAIQGQKWLPEAMQFLEANRAALAQKPFAAFMVCISLSMRGADTYRAGIAEWLAPVRAQVRTISEACFAGGLDFSKMPLTFNALLMRLPVLFGLWKTGDHRDWQAVNAWAESLAGLLN